MRTLHPIAAGSAPVAVGSRTCEAPARSRSVARLLVPDLALATAVVTFIYVFWLFGGATALFRDADAGWHIVNGQRILATGALPAVDPFSFSAAGKPWVAWEWGADVLSGALQQVAGLSGVAVFYGAAIAASVWLWFRLTWAAGGHFLLACALASPLLSTVSLHWLARPHVLGWVLLMVTVLWCERLPERVSGRQMGAAFLLGAVWANVHGSFFLGPLVFGIYALGTWLGRLVWGAERETAAVQSYFASVPFCLLGSLVNPHGWGLHAHVVGYLTDSALLDRIGEFQSFNFHSDGAAQIAMALLVGIAGGMAALASRNLARFFLALVITAGALRSARMLPVAALVLLPLANGALTAILRRAELAPRLRRALDGFLAYGDNLRRLDVRCGGLAVIPLAVMLVVAALKIQAGFPADQFPVRAADAVSKLPVSARVFSSDKFGGYLIYRFGGARKVYFDGRSDFYGAEFLKGYARLVQVRPGWQAEFAKGGFTHALLPPDFSLVGALQREGWREIYRDGTAVLLASPNSGANA